MNASTLKPESTTIFFRDGCAAAILPATPLKFQKNMRDMSIRALAYFRCMIHASYTHICVYALCVHSIYIYIYIQIHTHTYTYPH